MDVKVRALTEEDFAEVAFLDELSGDGVASMIDCEEYAWGIFADNKLIGYCTIGGADDGGYDVESEWTSDSLLLSDVFVLPEFRGRGIATLLVGEALKMANPENVPVFLTVLDDRLSYLYEGLGFKYLHDGTMVKVVPSAEKDMFSAVKDVSTEYACGENYFTMTYSLGDRVVGKLDYGEYDGEPNVKMIEVVPEYRRRGIGKKLLQALQSKYPGIEISFGMSTPEGTKLIENSTYTVSNTEVVSKLKRIEEIQLKLTEYDKGYEDFCENGAVLPDNYAEDYNSKTRCPPLQPGVSGGDTYFCSEAVQSTSEALNDAAGGLLNDLYDEMCDLKREVYGKKPVKVFVKTEDEQSRYSDVGGLDKKIREARERAAVGKLIQPDLGPVR